MSFSFTSAGLEITDRVGKTKFSLTRKMAPILFTASDVIQIPKILAYNVNASTVERTDEFTIVSNALINTNDYFVMPFYAINGGVSDNSGFITSGQGSVQVREIIQPSSQTYLGSSIMTTIVEDGAIKIICRHSFDRQGYTNISGDDTINIAYKIYYGRFT